MALKYRNELHFRYVDRGTSFDELAKQYASARRKVGAVAASSALTIALTPAMAFAAPNAQEIPSFDQNGAPIAQMADFQNVSDIAMPDGFKPPALPDGAMPDGSQPPALPDGATPDGSQPPALPDGATPDGSQPPALPDGQMGLAFGGNVPQGLQVRA